MFVDNIEALQTNSSTETATTYVYTFKNTLDQEGAPSNPTGIIYLDDGITTVITTPVVTPDDPLNEYSIDTKVIYRAVSGSLGTAYQFVTEIPLAQADYTDTLQDDETGPDILQTTDWEVPPTDGHSIIAMPNGITVIASGNQICPSVLNQPHSYPISYRLATDYPIVAQGAIDNILVVATQSNPYLVIGDDPSNLAMSKLEIPQGCVSARSLCSARDWGVIYASPDGLIGIRNSGVQLLSDPFYSRKEWQELVPESIHSVIHDNRYFGFYDTGSEQGGFMFDPRDLGNGLT